MPKSKGGSAREFVTHVPLVNLHLDPDNHRFGTDAGTSTDETAIVDRIVSAFGVGDVLSSIAVNGFFQSEPLVAIRGNEADSGFLVKEGNRRLTACLILTGDERASNQLPLTERYRSLWEENGRKNVETIPVIVHENNADLMAYIGVRHIAGSKPWDSYAKAAWIADAVYDRGIDLKTIVTMIGDKYNTAYRMLEGYNWIRQAQEEGHLKPNQSYRRGRGSATDFPFSWIYNALDHENIRKFLGLGPRNLNRSPDRRPISEKYSGESRRFLTMMFGDRHGEIKPLIDDSRQIGDLATALGNEKMRMQLRLPGASLEAVLDESRPALDRVQDVLALTYRELAKCLPLVTEIREPTNILALLLEEAKRTASQCRNVSNAIYSRMNPEVGDTDAERQ